VLNPFRTQLSQLSVSTGNPYLRPEIVNNFELGYTLAYKYNFKIAYSQTDDKITRLIGPDPIDPRAGFISWDNLATETVISFNASLPVKIKKWWDAFINLSASHIDNQADYGNGAIVDVQNYSYTIYQQHTFKLIKGIKGEISGYYSGPGVWGGVFKYEANWSVGAGLQKEFLKKKLKARLNANNIFNQIGWKGVSEFNGLTSHGYGNWDSHFVSLSLNYNFGNQNIKSRKRKTGIESESKRVGE
jgi:outer membrane receptor protein involved in Fe transport